MSKHTPGPWAITSKHCGGGFSRTISHMGVGSPIARIYGDPGPQELNQANAVLIAQAPTLLGWLKAAIKIMEELCPERSFTIRQVKAAIAKAEGGTDE